MGLRLPPESGAMPSSARLPAERGGTAMRFADFAVRAWRDGPRHVQVIAHATPVGSMRRPVAVRLDKIRRSDFEMGTDDSFERAAEIGRELARILLPEPVLGMLLESIRYAAQRADVGLRLRLCLDDELIDLPWECLYRTDMPDGAVAAGFYLADGEVSLVREPASLPFGPAPSERAQRALFMGALFDDGSDTWLTRDEHSQLVEATQAIRARVDFDFVIAGDTASVDVALAQRYDIFHYAGHVDTTQTPASLLQIAHYAVRPGLEAFGEAAPQPARWARADRLAPVLRTAGVRLAVFNACNSGHWSFMQPLMAQSIPAAIGVQGSVMNDAALAFAAALYQALAVGLSLDEAVSQGRLTVLSLALREPGVHPSKRQLWVSANDWLRFMVYMPSDDAVLFPRPPNAANAKAQRAARRSRVVAIESLYETIAGLSAAQRANVLSRISRSQVFILGRFDPAHKPTLDALGDALAAHTAKYQPMVFDFDKPQERNLTESVRTYALTSRFVIADISAPRCAPHELMAIVPFSPSIPVVPIIRDGSARPKSGVFGDRTHLNCSATGVSTHLQSRLQVDCADHLSDWHQFGEFRSRLFLPLRVQPQKFGG